jgi:hypothetical protein
MISLALGWPIEAYLLSNRHANIKLTQLTLWDNFQNLATPNNDC